MRSPTPRSLAVALLAATVVLGGAAAETGLADGSGEAAAPDPGAQEATPEAGADDVGPERPDGGYKHIHEADPGTGEASTPTQDGPMAEAPDAADAAGPDAVQYGGEEEPSDEARTAALTTPDDRNEAQVDAEALADRGRCEQARIMGVYARWSTEADVPYHEAPHEGYAEDGRYYWGVDDPRDDPALQCGTAPSGAAPQDGFRGLPSEAASGAAYTPSEGPPPAGPGQGGTPTPPDGGGDPVDPGPSSSQVSTAGYQAPPTGPPQRAAVALALGLAAIPVALVLYRKLTREDVLENETRKRILELVTERPGITTAEISEELDVHYRTARHHLETLEDFGKVTGKRLRGRIRYFENHGRFDDLRKRLISCLEADTKEAIIMEVARSGAVPSGELAERVDVAPSTASHHLGDLEEMGLLARRRDGRSKLYSLADGVMPALLDVAPTDDD
jgi:predicted transcriptional regulator